ncbi:glycosyltransferase family 39 protein [Candidatus Gottesmanbacteria bacterium]|nr:glycosyltransferase family 39 protein [Candidatus Gottesmanbacteria bacterium]
MKNLTPFAIAIVIMVAVAARFYHITGSVADWHSWRQVDTAAVARNFVKFGFDPFRPRFDDLSNIPSGKDNPSGWRMVEFPLYQSMAYGIWRLAPGVPMEIMLRLVTVGASVGTLIILYVLMAATAGKLAAFFGAFCYAVLPYSIYYGRVILPDPLMVFWAVLSVYLVFLATEKKRDWGFMLCAGIAGAFALLAKPMGLFLLLPIPYLMLRRNGFSIYSFIRMLVYSLICLFPLFWWRQWILQYPEGIAVYGWLFNEGNIRFKGAWFYWLFAKRVGELILGYWGLIPFGIGMLLVSSKKEGWLFRLWVIGGLLYFIVIARGNVQHDYYQILLIPIICVYLGKGFAFLFSNAVFSKAVSYQLSAISFLLLFSFSWYTARTYYWINRPEIVEAGKAADSLLPAGAKVIASYNGDTSFLYQTNRQGWPLGFEIDKKIEAGATHYVTVSPTDNDGETMALASRFTVLVRNERYAIIDLTKPKR